MSNVRILSASSNRVRTGVHAEPYRLSGVDLLPTHSGMPLVWVYPNGLDVEALERSLIDTLAKYPQIAGRVRVGRDGFAHLDSCDGGVDFRVHRCAGPLPPYGPDHSASVDIGRLTKAIYPFRVLNRDTPLMQVVVSVFEDGGAVLGVTIVHSICDGSAFFGFLHEWAKACRGIAPTGPSDAREVLIGLGRERGDRPYGGDLLYEPGLLERLRIYARFAYQNVTTLRKRVFRVGADRLGEWKLATEGRLPAGEFVGTGELVTAHCLKALSPVMRSMGERRVGVVSDLRYKLGARIPRGFFGNALSQSQVVYSAPEIERADPVELADKMRRSCKVDDADDLMGYLGFVEQYRERRALSRLLLRTVAATLDAGMLVNNYRSFPIYDLDFGTGTPTWHDGPRLIYRALKVIPTPEGDGGVDLHLTAHKKELAAVAAAFGSARTVA